MIKAKKAALKSLIKSVKDDAKDRLKIVRGQIKALANPLRQQILELMIEAPITTKQVADRLGEKPTKLYHHVDTLEAAGLI